MDTPRTTQDVLKSLTLKELDVLRHRFGLDDEMESNTSHKVPPTNGGDDGAGGVPAPAMPPA